MTTIHLVAGARPNFMKIAPIVRALQLDGRLSFKIIHTGQHYDREMNEVFFEELGIPSPDAFLGAGGGTHAQQTAKIMTAYEELCAREKPDCALVVGDVNSTLACSIVAKKACIPVAHVEAGLRSGDMTMPEEINRLVTDAIADWFFVSEPSGMDHLLHEGKPAAAIFHVGQVMVDTLLYQAQKLGGMDRSGFETSGFKARASTVRCGHPAPTIECRHGRRTWSALVTRCAASASSCRSSSRCTPAPATTLRSLV